MASALDAVLALKENEQKQAQQQNDNLTQGLQFLAQARQQAQENQLKTLLTNSEIQKNNQQVAAQAQQNNILQQALSGNMGSSMGGFGVKSIKIGDVTLEKPDDPINNGVPITDINSIQDPNMKNLVQGTLDYRIDPSKSTSIRNNEREKLVQMASAVDPSYDQTQFPARAQFRKSLTSGQLSKNIISANTVIGHLDSLKDSLDDLNNARSVNGIPMINSLENAGLNATGNGVVKAAKLNADAVSNELETLFRGTNGSLSGVQEFKKNFDLSSSPDQQKAVINKAVNLVSSRVDAVDQQAQSVMGKPRDFSVLNDKSKKILAKLGIDPSSVDSYNNNQSNNITDFSSEADALKANLPKGTVITIGGKKARID